MDALMSQLWLSQCFNAPHYEDEEKSSAKDLTNEKRMFIMRTSLETSTAWNEQNKSRHRPLFVKTKNENEKSFRKDLTNKNKIVYNYGLATEKVEVL